MATPYSQTFVKNVEQAFYREFHAGSVEQASLLKRINGVVQY
jgi:hypothetical protein